MFVFIAIKILTNYPWDSPWVPWSLLPGPACGLAGGRFAPTIALKRVWKWTVMFPLAGQWGKCFQRMTHGGVSDKGYKLILKKGGGKLDKKF